MSAGLAREHQWDSLRAFLMLLGIPYHAAMAYNARVLWDIQSPDKSEILTFLSGVLVSFHGIKGVRSTYSHLLNKLRVQENVLELH